MSQSAWPELNWDEWKDTATTLHMWTQMVGKTRLGLTPLQNHWWNVPLYVSARGLTTSAIPYAGGCSRSSSIFWPTCWSCARAMGRGCSWSCARGLWRIFIGSTGRP